MRPADRLAGRKVCIPATVEKSDSIPRNAVQASLNLGLDPVAGTVRFDDILAL